MESRLGFGNRINTIPIPDKETDPRFESFLPKHHLQSKQRYNGVTEPNGKISKEKNNGDKQTFPHVMTIFIFFLFKI